MAQSSTLSTLETLIVDALLQENSLANLKVVPVTFKGVDCHAICWINDTEPLVKLSPLVLLVNEQMQELVMPKDEFLPPNKQ